MELNDVQRRLFLTRGVQVVAALLADPSASAVPHMVNAELLDLKREELDRLRRQDGRQGAAQVIGSVTGIADHLARMLPSAPDGSPLRRKVARLTAEAADLSAWVATDQGFPRLAVQWNAAGETAARLAQDTDLVALSIGDQARAALKGGQVQRSLELFSRLPVRLPLTPSTRMYIEFQRAESLGRAGQEHAAHEAIERAVKAADQASHGEAPPWVSVVSGDEALDVFRGHCYVAMGLPERAYELLRPTLAGYPESMRRGKGVLHLALAEAAAQTRSVDRACQHLAAAGEIFAETQSVYRQERVTAIRQGPLRPFADTHAVRELDDRLHEATRSRPGYTEMDTAPPVRPRPRRRTYVQVRSEQARPRWMLHTADCPIGQSAKRRWPFAEARGRRPDHLARDEAITRRNLPCSRCIGELWS